MKFPIFNWQFYPSCIKWDKNLKGKHAGENYSLEATITIISEDTQRPPYDVSLFGVRYFPAILLDYSTCVYLRYQDETNYIQILFSPNDKEVALFHPEGGILAVGRCPALKTKRAFHVKAEIYKESLAVLVDGKHILSYKKIGAWSEQGQSGSGCWRAKVIFQDVKIKQIDSLSADHPVKTQPKSFAMKRWHKQKWIFHGAEPIARFYTSVSDTNTANVPGLGLVDVKLRPGREASAGTSLWWTLMNDEQEGAENTRIPLDGREVPFSMGAKPTLHTMQLDSLHCSHSSSQSITCKWKTHSKKHIVKAAGQLHISYDSKSDRYYYDIETTANPDPKYRWTRLEYADPYANRGIGCANPALNWNEKYNWFIYEGEKGKFFKIPLNHNVQNWNAMPLSGSLMGWLGDQDSNVMVIRKDTPTIISLCMWGYDLHLCHAGWPLKNEYKASYRITTYNKREVRQLLKKASFSPIVAQHESFPAFILGKNSFAPQQWRKTSEPHPEQRWSCSPSAWEKHDGHSDNYSLRIRGPGCISTIVGEGQFYGPFPYRSYELIAWIKTEDVTNGQVYIQYNQRKSKRLAATHKWTRIKIKVPAPLPQAEIRLVLDGKGTAWFDDIELKAIKNK